MKKKTAGRRRTSVWTERGTEVAIFIRHRKQFGALASWGTGIFYFVQIT